MEAPRKGDRLSGLLSDYSMPALPKFDALRNMPTTMCACSYTHITSIATCKSPMSLLHAAGSVTGLSIKGLHAGCMACSNLWRCLLCNPCPGPGPGQLLHLHP